MRHDVEGWESWTDRERTTAVYTEVLMCKPIPTDGDGLVFGYNNGLGIRDYVAEEQWQEWECTGQIIATLRKWGWTLDIQAYPERCECTIYNNSSEPNDFGTPEPNWFASAETLGEAVALAALMLARGIVGE